MGIKSRQYCCEVHKWHRRRIWKMQTFIFNMEMSATHAVRPLPRFRFVTYIEFEDEEDLYLMHVVELAGKEFINEWPETYVPQMYCTYFPGNLENVQALLHRYIRVNFRHEGLFNLMHSGAMVPVRAACEFKSRDGGKSIIRQMRKIALDLMALNCVDPQLLDGYKALSGRNSVQLVASSIAFPPSFQTKKMVSFDDLPAELRHLIFLFHRRLGVRARYQTHRARLAQRFLTHSPIAPLVSTMNLFLALDVPETFSCTINHYKLLSGSIKVYQLPGRDRIKHDVICVFGKISLENAEREVLLMQLYRFGQSKTSSIDTVGRYYPPNVWIQWLPTHADNIRFIASAFTRTIQRIPPRLLYPLVVIEIFPMVFRSGVVLGVDYYPVPPRVLNDAKSALSKAQFQALLMTDCVSNTLESFLYQNFMKTLGNTWF
ncbi:hypothetical protein BC832DRAFT_608455 [Gaertneriomyces semiglobifer]|nr:hypothetical protein BC832DRAFT_608455 [Gaertneriomyces semiglobifer]